MGTYFHVSSEIQAAADGLQTLYLMNPNYVPYTDTQHQHPAANMLFLNPAGHALNQGNLPHAQPPPNQHFVGIPLIAANNSDDPSRASMLATQEISGLHGAMAAPSSRVHYNLWDHTAATTSDVGTPQMGFRGPTAQQGLSLSLSSQQPPYRSLSGEQDVVGNSPSSASAVSNGISGMQSVILGSKYLKAAQEVLDEVVNVGKGIKVEGTKEKITKMNKESKGVIGDFPGEGSSSSTKQATELTTAQRQELQMKKAKLVTMLDEVEQRYREYHHQMQIVVSSFEQAAGLGSARSYTALALQTISKQFRCLKDAICSQIKGTSKSLGDQEDCFGAKAEGSRLKYVDQQLRQQRALQQFGMLQHNAWRPQRGLPERAVSVLRAWLFDHFLHPYPKDADKILLAKQTGLTRSQVSNWFINARVRLWKPMVEEMYSEEVKEQEQSCSQDNNKRECNKESNIEAHSGFNLVGLSDMQRSPKQPRSSEMQNSPNTIISMDMDMKPRDEEASEFVKERHGKDGYSFISDTYSVGEFGRFSIPEGMAAPRFQGNNGVSLTLGLPHCENNLSVSAAHTQQSFLSPPQSIQMGRRRSSLEMGTGDTDFCVINAPQASHSNTGYGNINDIQSRKRFAQLLPDFVA
ncbi:BEL1-like homeodomain protein 1 [Corylus avellana]|uniref:BEL1-like homeodomain protein 1 n=1 Tax=Corylus avellana TaxID=13451 RepID=UPI001E1EC4A7|nr:BEL1-like homeodomain protein 1 [Corylus avellana]XP_059430392.1 BEL1-like homeodomain protein 1 [Corylus avellana]XP_059430393.1 BEL1-like homeodomain protein 1 [Corylus avellana]